MTSLRLLISITAAYGYMAATVLEKFPLLKLAAINVLMTGRMPSRPCASLRRQ